jgi:type I restriction enzyme S subunit
MRLRHVARVNPTSPIFDSLSEDEDITFLRMESVWPGVWRDLSEVRKKADVVMGFTRFQDGDILVPKITPTFEASRSIIVDSLVSRAGAGTTELHVVRPGSKIIPRFILYAMHTHRFLRVGEAEMYGVAGQKRVPDDFLRDLKVWVPSLGEQRRVADFLDAEVARIDYVVAARRRQLALFDERASSLLSERLIPGVVSGANGQFPWPWLPSPREEVPLVRLGYVCQVQGGVTVDASRKPSEGDVTKPYLRVANVKADRLDLESVTSITVPKSVADRSTLLPGDVLMTEGGDIDKLGRGTVWRGEIPGALHQNHVFALRPDPSRLDAEYLALLTRSVHGRCYFEATGVKSTNLASTSSSKVKSFPIPLPALREQRSAVMEVNSALEGASRLRDALESQITLLEERKRALITAAVTGQIDVTTARGADVS